MKIKKKILSTLFILSVISQSSLSTFAQQYKDYAPGYSNVTPISDSSLLVDSNDNKSQFFIKEDNFNKIIIIKDFHTKSSEYIKLNKLDGILYSSYVDKSFDLNNPCNQSVEGLLGFDGESVSSYKPDPNNPITGPWITGKTRTISKTYYLSYAQIKRIVGKVATVASVSGAILSLIPKTNKVGGTLATISGVVITLNNNSNPSSKHGLKIKVNIIQKLNKNGKYYNFSSTIKSCTLY